MKFVVSSTELLGHLQAISRVISSKNTLPILDNFLFNLSGNDLEITASDLESTLITHMRLDNVDGSGTIALPARILLDTLKEFSEQPLTFDINPDTMAVVINSENGRFSVVGQNGIDFPVLPVIKKEKKFSFNITADILLAGISRTLFATADDELRPVMGGILVEASTEKITFVASDAHKLVRYQRSDAKADDNASFILPKKPASLLKNILPRESGAVSVEFDDRNAFFILSDYKVVCRLVEGNYPNYRQVIPTEMKERVTLSREELLHALRRAEIMTSEKSNSVKLSFAKNKLEITANSPEVGEAKETIAINYKGDDVAIAFNPKYMIDPLNSLDNDEVFIELIDELSPGVLKINGPFLYVVMPMRLT